MQMLRAIIRPEKESETVKALDENGFTALTKMNVFGRGKQRGLQIGDVHYRELSKVMLMLVVPKKQTAVAVETIKKAAYTGAIGDGKIFITPVETSYTIRTGLMEK